jgi:hypothetical protein
MFALNNFFMSYLNATSIYLIAAIVILLVIIIALAQVLLQLAKKNNHKTILLPKSIKAGTISKTTVLFLILSLHDKLLFAQNTLPEKKPVVDQYIGGLSSPVFYSMVGFIAFELLIAGALMKLVYQFKSAK